MLNKIIIIALCAILALCSCRTTKPVQTVIVVDSVRTEVRIETVYVHDTVTVPLPPEDVSVTTPDTTSRLETSVAFSEAGIRDGMLWHHLWNKPSIDVPVDHKETVRDSIVYKEKPVPVPYPVEKEVVKPLTWWQQLRLWLGSVAFFLIIVAAAYGLFRLVRLWRR